MSPSPGCSAVDLAGVGGAGQVPGFRLWSSRYLHTALYFICAPFERAGSSDNQSAGGSGLVHTHPSYPIYAHVYTSCAGTSWQQHAHSIHRGAHTHTHTHTKGSQTLTNDFKLHTVPNRERLLDGGVLQEQTEKDSFV